MAEKQILHMVTPLKHMSPFDVNMALDAGYDDTITYTGVTLEEIPALVQDAMFSRPPKSGVHTAMFFGGKNAVLALDMLAAAKKAMVPPFGISLLADPAGSFTTAAAMVAKVGKLLRDKHGAGWRGRTVAVFGATGVVGFASAVIAAGEGARAILVGYDGAARVTRLAESAKRRFGVDLTAADGSSDAAKAALLADAEIVFSAGRAGVMVLSAPQIATAGKLLVAADVNAVPPSGIEGVGVQDDGKPIPGAKALGLGPLAIGGVKYKVEAGLFRRMIETPKPLYIDFRDAFGLAREIVG